MPKLKKGDIVEFIYNLSIVGRPKGSRATILSICEWGDIQLCPKGTHDGVFGCHYVKLIKTRYKIQNIYKHY